VPVYDPAWIWGPPIYYPYPRWHYPVRTSGIFFSFGRGINVGLFLGGGWSGWGGWGWQPAWGNRTIIVNNNFVHRYNFNSARSPNFSGTTVWSHDAVHRQGVPYAAPALTDRYRAGVRENLGPGAAPAQGRAHTGRQAAAASQFERNAAPATPAGRPGRPVPPVEWSQPWRPAAAPASCGRRAPAGRTSRRSGLLRAPNRNRAFRWDRNGDGEGHTVMDLQSRPANRSSWGRLSAQIAGAAENKSRVARQKE
jgi:hypothetical protein